MDRLAELIMAERHVQQGERVVEAQRLIVDRLRRSRAPTATAELLLDRFELCLSNFRQHLATVLREIDDEYRTSSATPCHSSNGGPDRTHKIYKGKSDVGP